MTERDLMIAAMNFAPTRKRWLELHGYTGPDEGGEAPEAGALWNSGNPYTYPGWYESDDAFRERVSAFMKAKAVRDE